MLTPSQSSKFKTKKNVSTEVLNFASSSWTRCSFVAIAFRRIRPRETGGIVPRIDDFSRRCMRNNRRKRRQLQKEHREKRQKEGNPAGQAGSAGAIKNRAKSKVRRETLRLLSPADGIDRERSTR